MLFRIRIIRAALALGARSAAVDRAPLEAYAAHLRWRFPQGPMATCPLDRI